MNIVNELYKKNLFKENDVVGVGLSGGADSVALLMLMLDLKKLVDIEVFAVHINHGLREEALLESQFVKKLLKRNGISGLFFNIDNSVYDEVGKSTEQIAREERYKIFRKVISDKKCFIALGHHREDQVETVFLNFLRGTGLTGLAGMREINGSYIRPLLDFSKADLLEYLEEVGETYITDESNFEDIYVRNLIRNDVIPYIIHKTGIDINQKIHSMSRLVAQDEEYLELITHKVFLEVSEIDDRAITIDINTLKDFHSSVIRRVIRRAIFEIKGDLVNISSINVADIIELFKSENKEIIISKGIYVKKDYDKLRIGERKDYKKIRKIKVDRNSIGEDAVIFGDFKIKVINDFLFTAYSNQKYKKWFDYDKIKSDLFLRPREEGDYISINGGKKSIKKLFIDKKINKVDRDSIFLVADGKEVLWAVGVRYNDRFKVTKDTNKVIEIEYLGEVYG